MLRKITETNIGNIKQKKRKKEVFLFKIYIYRKIWYNACGTFIQLKEETEDGSNTKGVSVYK